MTPEERATEIASGAWLDSIERNAFKKAIRQALRDARNDALEEAAGRIEERIEEECAEYQKNQSESAFGIIAGLKESVAHIRSLKSQESRT